MKQKKNHQALNTVWDFQSFFGNFRETSLLVTHIASSTPPVLCGAVSCPLPATLCIPLSSNLQVTCSAAISSEECTFRCYLRTSVIHLTCISQPPVQCVPGIPSLGRKWLGHKVDHSPPSSAKAENEWSCVSVPLYAFIAWTGENFTLTFTLDVHVH
jgi:hypothetical protein